MTILRPHLAIHDPPLHCMAWHCHLTFDIDGYLLDAAVSPSKGAFHLYDPIHLPLLSPVTLRSVTRHSAPVVPSQV